ncbi:hypothetical protein GCM10027592_29280 [Spirosoma flavus]
MLMKKDQEQFIALIENYVFRVVEACIAEVDAKTQDRLIRLFIDIGDDLPELFDI